MIFDEHRIAKQNRRKRVFDLALVAGLAPVLTPIGLATAAAVRFSMGRPVLFKQPRIGLNERQFNVLKFRTMREATDADGNPLPDQRRLTRVGTALRKLSLDELPQLVNVLRGDMSLVGPRPLYTHYMPYYTPQEARRHLVRPGITGLAQVSGRNAVAWNERLRLDVEYVETVSLLQDLKIILATGRQVFKGSGVSVVANESGEPLHIVRSYPARDGVSMRRFEYRDIPERVRLFNDANIRRHMQLPSNVTMDGTKDWLKRARGTAGYHDFVFYDTRGQTFVGLAGLRAHPGSRSPELYILIDPRLQGQGMGKAALAVLLDWMRSNPSFDSCWLTVSQQNSPAVALYKSAGFVTRNVTESEDGVARLEMELSWDGDHEFAKFPSE